MTTVALIKAAITVFQPKLATMKALSQFQVAATIKTGGAAKEVVLMKSGERIFSVEDYVRPCDGEPIRSVVLETEDATVVVWHAHPDQEIAAHVHPHGQDTWTVISGEAEYYKGEGFVAHLAVGDIAIAKAGQVHGALNTGSVPFIFVSVVASGNAGFALAEK